MRALLLCTCFLALAAAATISMAEQIATPDQAAWADAKKKVTLPNGIEMAYSEMGDTEGKPLLLIHGFTDNSRSWSLVAPFLATRHVYAIDLRGHGKSTAPDCCYALTDFANDAALFLDAVKIERADVVGHSLGSMTAQLLAAQHPEKVNKVVLLSSSVKSGGGPGTWLWDNIMPLTPPIDPNGQFMMDWYWNPNPVDDSFIAPERTESAAVPEQVWKGVMWGLSSSDLSVLAPLVQAPMMIVWGDQDQLFDATHQDALRAAYPKARFETFAKAGHNMFWEEPQRAAELINGFLE